MSGSLHAYYSLRDLESLADRGVALSGELPLRKLARLASLLHSDVGSVRASLHFRQRRDGWLAVTLDCRARVQLVCQRCLEPFCYDVSSSPEIVLADAAAVPGTVAVGHEPFEVEDGRLLPAQLIEEVLFVSVPLVP
jgi:uncharacterized protein